MEFHISRKARDRYAVSSLLFNYAGNAVFADLTASRELAHRVNQVRQAEFGDAAAPIHAGALFAMGLIDELSHVLIASYRETHDPEVHSAALQWFEAIADQVGVEKLLRTFTAQFPNVAIYRGEQTVAAWLDATTDGLSNREAAFEELLLLWLANINPAYAPFKEFFDDGDLARQTIYQNVTANLDDYFATRPLVDPAIGTLLDALRAPILASPNSLTGQLAFIQEKWADFVGEDLRQVLLAIDTVKEEDVAIWMSFHPPSDSPAARAMRHGQGQGQGWGSEGFEGDEFMGFAGAEAQRSREGQAQQPTVHEYEAFSPDQAWMPTVVLIAKSTYVWLEQLSKKYQRHIYRLDHIPEEELQILADRGMNGLWLIGLWERSTASQTIKRLRGQADAVASAYSVADYRIAQDLGGEDAYRVLRDRAAAKGVRLASDMVPNHMGIDSTWVMEHPEWFISRDHSPFPVYSFEGPDLSRDSRYEIKIDDHYYDQTDAAVVFRLRNRGNGHDQFLYHGNDGTTFAWNDTAQLDYSKAFVREQVMQTILAVARLFPIIRFDAAMTLAKKHVQRLWFPMPGVGGSIPSRAESAMSNEEFDSIMPNEFWREVVDRVAVEVPGTLLLAEAFWLLEGYFVRTLGMHRVYNSAFMNMVRDEENAKYRSYLKKTIEFDPDILKRYVNFMSNPDERTAIDQFGSGDRYFGVATVLATIPGLPMFGHGQVEAYTEKYGMEYKTAKFDEYPNEDLVARHNREIAPLLKNRRLFAESENFVLYDFWTAEGTVDENVYAYSNRLGDERAIILFNNRYGGTRGTIHTSAESMDKGSGTQRTRSLREALNLQSDDGLMVAFKDTVTGLEYLRYSRSLDNDGLTLDLRAYQYTVLQDWRELRSTTEHPWDALCDALHGAGVYHLHDALSKLRLRPLHDALHHCLSREQLRPFVDFAGSHSSAATVAATTPPDPETPPHPVEHAETLATEDQAKPADTSFVWIDPFLHHAGQFLALAPHLAPQARAANLDTLRRAITAVGRLPLLEQQVGPFWPDAATILLPIRLPESTNTALWAQVLAATVLEQLTTGDLSVFDDLQLREALAETFASMGLEGENAWRAAARIRILLAYPRPEASATLEQLLASEVFWSHPDVRWLAGISEVEGKVFFNKECFEELVSWLLLPDLLRLKAPDTTSDLLMTVNAVMAAVAQSGYELPRLIQALTSPAPVTEPPHLPITPTAEDEPIAEEETQTVLEDVAATEYLP